MQPSISYGNNSSHYKNYFTSSLKHTYFWVISKSQIQNPDIRGFYPESDKKLVNFKRKTITLPHRIKSCF